MNIAYTIKGFLFGLTLITKQSLLNSIFTFVHPIKCYEYESKWFLEVHDSTAFVGYSKGTLYGMVPQTFVYGLIALLRRKLSGKCN